MPSCSIPGCNGRKRRGVKMFTFPKINDRTVAFKELSKGRQQAWLLALGRYDCDPKLYEKLQICDSHFISGKMASLQDTDNLDWIPTINLSSQGNSSNILRCSVVGCTVSNQGGQCSFYRIPNINEHGALKEFSAKKLSTWLSALGVEHDDEPLSHEYLYVCHAHYIIEMSDKLRNKSTVCLDGNSSDSLENQANASQSTVCNVISRVSGLNVGIKVNSLPLVSLNHSTSTSEKSSAFFKSGEILRNELGKFAFSCGYCDAINGDSHDMMNHINRHLSTSPLPSPEFVSCTTTTNEKMEPENDDTFQKFIDKPKLSLNTRVAVFSIKLIKPKTQEMHKRCLLSKPNIDDLTSSRLCKIKKIDLTPTTAETTPTTAETTPTTAETTPTTAETTATTPETTPKTPDTTPTTKWKLPIRIPDMPTINGKSVTISNPTTKSKRDVSNPETLKCNQCMLVPSVGETDQRPYKCKECEKLFPNHVDYRTHYVQKHRIQTPTKCYQCEMEPSITTESDSRRHKCVICQEWFTNHIEFKTHLTDAHNEHALDNDFTRIANDYKEFTCYICEKNLKQREYLLFHAKGHFEKYLQFQCHLCGLRVRTESTLKEHMKRHENKPTECDVCNRMFSKYMRMREHRMCHTDELNHVCTVCSKGFKLKKYLTRHMAVHNEVKIFCRFCDASFKFSTGRRAHEKSGHNV